MQTAPHPNRGILLFLAFAILSAESSLEAVARSTSLEDKILLAQKFNQEVERQVVQDEGFFQSGKVTTIWNVLDEVVVDLLNAGESTETITRFLTTLRGYEGPTYGVVIGNAIFSNGRHAVPTYLLMQASARNPGILLGAYNYGYNGLGRLSVYTRTGSRWSRTDRFDGTSFVSLRLLPYYGDSLPLLTIERYTGGDHEDGHVKAWWLRGGKLASQNLGIASLLDPDVEETTAGVSVFYSVFPDNLAGAFLGIRMQYELAIHASAGRIQAQRNLLNPWVNLINEFYGYVAAKNLSKANALLESPSLMAQLRYEHHPPDPWEAEGDLERGMAYVVLQKDDGFIRVDIRRNSSGTWKVRAVRSVAEP